MRCHVIAQAVLIVRTVKGEGKIQGANVADSVPRREVQNIQGLFGGILCSLRLMTAYRRLREKCAERGYHAA
jgi:hypothetical protein